MTERQTRSDLFNRLQNECCPQPGCDGALSSAVYKGTDAMVCDDCGTPSFRVW